MAKTGKKRRDLFEDLEIYAEDSDIIPLAMGAPGPSALAGCKDLIMKATIETLNDPNEERFIFQYGPCRGDPTFCENLARFLSEEYNDKTISSDNLMVTAGATQGLHLVTTVLFDEDTPIFVEDPTYFIAIKVFTKDLGMKIIPVATDENGIIVTELEKLIKNQMKTGGIGKNKKSPFKAMLYTMTTLHNPRGCSLSAERSYELIRLARQYDLLLFTEDVYNLLHYDSSPPPRLLSYDKKEDEDYKGHVLSNCTFSKILAPGLRLGWIEASDRVIKMVSGANTAWSGGSFNHYTSRLVSTALKSGMITSHLKHLRQLYAERMQFVCETLKKNLPASVAFTEPKGGFFIWITFPNNFDGDALLRLAISEYHVNFITGSSTSPTSSYRNCIRLSISFCDMDKLKTGIQRLIDAIKQQMSETPGMCQI